VQIHIVYSINFVLYVGSSAVGTPQRGQPPALTGGMSAMFFLHFKTFFIYDCCIL